LVVSGTFNLNDSATNFSIQGNTFSQTYLNSNGAIVLNPGYGGVEMVGSYRELRLNDIYANGFVSGEIRANNGVVSGSSQIDITSTTGYSTFSSSNASIDSTQNTKLTNLENKTGSLSTTGSNTFYGNQTISGTVYIANDLVVQGSSCIQNITGSSLNIGTNIVSLNTATPSVRYAGMTVQDSGSSAGVTGSILWDSLCNRWMYSNPSTVGYSGGIIMSGPRAATLGAETTLTCNYIAKSGGGDHLYDSCIIDDGTIVCVNTTLKASGQVCGVMGNFSCIGVGTTTPIALFNVDKTNTDYTSPAGAHILLNNSSAIGQTSIYYQINGTLRGKLRADQIGNFNYVANGGDHTFWTGGDSACGGSTRMVIASNGQVLIGTACAQSGTKLQVAGNMDVWSSANTLLRLNHDGTRGVVETYTGGAYSNTTINPSGGNVGIGTTCIMDTLTVGNNGGVILQRFTGANPYSGDLYFYSARGTVSSPTAKSNGDVVMGIRPRGFDGTSYLDVVAIESKIEGTPTTNIICGNLIFSTNGGGTTLTERMRIGSDGVAELKQYIKIGTGINSTCYLGVSENQVWRNGGGIMYINSSGTGNVAIATGGGKVGIGTTPTTGVLQTGDAGIASTNTYFGTGQVRIGGGSDHSGNTVLSVAPGVITFDRPGVGGGALTINSNGQLTLPSQPSFFAASTSGQTEFSTGAVMVFNTTRHNTGSHYNTSTGRFTAPVAGKYLFSVNFYTYANLRASITFAINGSQYQPGDVVPLLYHENDVGSISSGFTILLSLSANDYVEVRSRAGYVSTVYMSHSHFLGQLLS
jgi:hypothetical protein